MLIGRKLKGFTSDEKRRDRRTPVALPMQVGSARATMTDISLGGFAFEDTVSGENGNDRHAYGVDP